MVEGTVDQKVEHLREIADLSIEEWRFKRGDFPGPEHPDFDDSGWKIVGTDFKWLPPDSKAWYRKWIEVPPKIGGLDVTGSKIELVFHIDDDGVVYINGKRIEGFHSRSQPILLTKTAQPGERFLVAVHNINRAVSGQLETAELHSDRSEKVVGKVRDYLKNFDAIDELVFVGSGQSEMSWGLERSLSLIDLNLLQDGEVDAFISTLEKANQELLSDVLEISKRKTRRQLRLVREKLSELDDPLERAEQLGIDVSYPRVSQTVVRNFIVFAGEDMDSGETDKVIRAASIADYLLSSCNRGIEEADEFLGDPSKALKVPKYLTGDVEIRDGAFYQHDQPLFFTGFGHFDQVRKDIPIFPDYGFNIIQVLISASQILITPDSVNTGVIDKLVETLDRAAQHNIAVNVLLGPGGNFPRWAFEKYPEVRTKPLGFIDFNIDHPYTREIMRRYLEELIPRIAGHPALFSYDLTNEPTYTDDSKYSLEGFRNWLREKHGTVERLNKAYGSDYRNFEDVKIPTEKDPRPVWYEWCLYNQDRFFAFHDWMKDVIREMDPKTPIHMKVQGTVFDSQRYFQVGINHEDSAKLDRISGNDNYSYYQPDPDEEYAEGWLRQSMYCNLQRSVAPDNPIFNSENHPIRDADPMWVSSDHMGTMLWQGAIHGQGATTTWIWDRSQGGCTANNILTRPNCVEAFGRAALDLLRLGDYLVALQRAKGEVALLFSPSSIPLFDAYLDEMRNAYEGLYFLDTPIGFVSEGQIAKGELSQYKLLIAPRAAYVSDRTVARIVSFVRNGGTLLMVGDTFKYDEYGNERGRSDLFPDGQRPEGNGVWELGDGKVVYVSDPMEPRGYAELLDGWIDKAGIVRKVRAADDYNHRLWGVHSLVVEVEGGYLIYLVNLLGRPRTAHLIAEEPLGEATDLISGRVSGSLFELSPLQPMILLVDKLRD